MSDKPKRRFWQIHLSTAVLMMLTLGLFLGQEFSSEAVVENSDPFGPFGSEYWGWPIPLYVRYVRFGLDGSGAHPRGPIHTYGDPSFCLLAINDTVLDGFVIDGLVIGGGTAAVAFVCEVLIRRRSIRNS